MGAQAGRAGAAGGRGRSSRSPPTATSTRASRPRRPRFATRLRLRGRARRASAPSSASAAALAGRVATADGRRRPRASRTLVREARLGRRADGRGDLGAVRDPGLPLARHRAVGERRPDGGRPHRRLARATRSASGTSTATASRRCGDKQPNGAHRALVELERRGQLDAVITQNIDRLHRRAGTQRLVEVHGTIDTSSCLTCGARARSTRCARGWRPRRSRVPALRLRRAAEARRRAVRRVPARGRARAGLRAGRRRPTCCSASAPRWRSTRSRSCPGVTRQAGGEVAIVTAGPDALGRPRRRQARRRRRRRARGPARRALARAA